MKIGILTFHYGYNYGGVLQAYALQEYIKLEKHDVKIINYVPDDYNVNLLYGVSKRHPFRSFKKVLANIFHQEKSINNFDNFRDKYLNTTEKTSTISGLENVCKDFDVIIVGSDQIWNPSQHDKKVYFLNFNLNNKTRKISYAACCTINQVSIKNKNLLKTALDSFDAISVRNNETESFVFDLVSKKKQTVLDPTFLWSFGEMLNSNKRRDDYILTYVIGSELDGSNAKAIEKIKSEYGDMPVYAIVIGAVAGVVSVPWADNVIYDASPIEWLNYINNASLLFTDSFHGIVFAIKFKTKFIGYYNEYLRASRFIDLKKTYKLDNYIIKTSQDIIAISDFDFMKKLNEVEQINNEKLRESTDFIIKNIK